MKGILTRLVIVALSACESELAPKPKCDVIPLATGNWWRWQSSEGFYVKSDTVGVPVTIHSKEYYRLKGEPLGLGGADLYVRIEDSCRLIVWDEESEKVFIDFDGPVRAPQAFRFRGSGIVTDYEVTIYSKRGQFSYPEGTSNTCYVIRVVAPYVTDSQYYLVFAPGVGVIRWGGGLYSLSLALSEFHVKR